MVKLLSVGTAVPEGLLHQEEAFQIAKNYNCGNEREERVLRKLYQRTLIASRPTILNHEGKDKRFAMHDFYPLPTKSPTTPDSTPGTTGDTDLSCLSCGNQIEGQPGTAARMRRYKDEIAPLAQAAAQRALAKIDLSASAIDNLVTVSCTGFFAPGFDTQIIEALSLRRDVSRTHVGFMGCHGAMNGLRVASALARENQSISLVVAAELCSLHFQYGRKNDDLLANALFADGAAAAVLCGESNKNIEYLNKATDQQNLTLAASASYLLPDSSKAMTWEIGDHGFSMTLSAEVPDLIKQSLGPWIKAWLARFDLKIGDIGSWAVHPGGPKILDAAQAALCLEDNALAVSRQIFTSLGNMSSPTVLFIIERLLAVRAAGPIVALAFGPGLTIEAALFI